MKFGINNPAWLQCAGNIKDIAILRITSLSENNTISFSSTKLGLFANNIQYCINDNEWTQLSASTVITLGVGETAYFKNLTGAIYTRTMGNLIATVSDKYSVGGDIVGVFYPNSQIPEKALNGAFKNDINLVDASELLLTADTLNTQCYSSMFYGCTSLTKAPELPATTLAQYCYAAMFYGCTSLTEAPELPATTLKNQCYYNMFYGCTALTKAPELPATTLDTRCYECMFFGCTSLTEAPELPATTITEKCYLSMFEGCTSLTEAPELPATTLENQCYSRMFNGCTSLTKAPELPATRIIQSCYPAMFSGCTALANISCFAESASGAGYTTNWLYGVAENGTFTKNANATFWESGVNGIPDGWTVEEYAG